MANFLAEPISIFGTNPTRKIGDFKSYITINETATDKVTITKHPIQTGASVTDHAYKEPTVLSMSIQVGTSFLSKSLGAPDFLSGSSLSDIYKEFIAIQNAREPLAVYTGKRTYTNMILTSLGNTTDRATENVLALQLSFEEVILVEVTPTVVPPRSKQRTPGATGATEKAGKKQSSLVQGDNALFGGFFGRLFGG